MIKFNITNPGAPAQEDSEVTDLKTRLKELQDLSKIHQKVNGELRVKVAELESDNKRLAKEVEDKLDRLRKNGGL